MAVAVASGDEAGRTYEHHPDFAHPPPVDAAPHVYGTVTNSANPVDGVGRVRRVSSVLAVDRVTPSGTGALDDASRAVFGAADDVGSFTVEAKHLPGGGGSWNTFGQGVDPHRAIHSICTEIRQRAVLAEPQPSEHIPGRYRCRIHRGQTG